MTQEKKKLSERINYVVTTSGDETHYTGESVNYGCCCSAHSIEELQRKMKAMIQMWIKFAEDTMDESEPLEMHLLTEDEWQKKDDNIDYWEIERIKRILQRPTIQAKWKQVIENALLEHIDYGVGTQAIDVINALINQENK